MKKIKPNFIFDEHVLLENNHTIYYKINDLKILNS